MSLQQPPSSHDTSGEDGKGDSHHAADTQVNKSATDTKHISRGGAKICKSEDTPISEEKTMDSDSGAAGDPEGKRAEKSEKQVKPPKHPNGIKQARRDKRKAGWERKKALIKAAKKAKRKEREEAMRQAGHEIPATGTLWRDLPREQWSVSQKIRMAKKTEFEELAHSGGYRVCVDMAFDHLMPEKARASMVQQILYLYGSNKKAKQPCLVTLSGMGSVMTTAVQRLAGFNTWVGFTTETRCYTEVFKKEELVYLTADSPNTIDELEKGKVYIIGGIVDRNSHKGLCFKKATDHGIATARLPLKKEDLNGSASKVLATNHVFDILVGAMESEGDLQQIEHQTLPPRKRAGWISGDNRQMKGKTVTDYKQGAGDKRAGSGTAGDNGGESGCVLPGGTKAAVDGKNDGNIGKSTSAVDDSSTANEDGEREGRAIDAEKSQEKNVTSEE